MAQMTRTHARVCLFWLSLILHPILGIRLPTNPNFWGVNRHFPDKCVKYWNVHIIKTTTSIITKFCRVIETHKYSLWVVQICPKWIQYGGRPPCWIVEFAKFYWLTVSGGHKRITVPNFAKVGRSIAEIENLKIKMAAAAILDFWNCEILLAI